MIDNSTIFIKSEKGKELLRKSSRELTVTERQILILVDGQKTASELISQLSILKNVSAILENLFQKGFIQTSKVQLFQKSQASKRAASKAASQAKNRQYQLTSHNVSVLENALIEFLGPMGRFVFAEILEKASTFEEVNNAILAEISRDQRARYKEMLAAQLQD